MEGSSSTAGTGPIQPVVTISASYGAGGSTIAPMLAQRLQLPFVDRLLSADISQEAGRSASGEAGAPRSSEGLSEAEDAGAPRHRLFSYLAWGAGVSAIAAAPPVDLNTDDGLRQRAEVGLGEIRSGAGGVVLGRAAAVVLARRPRTYHVRLDGPADRRTIAAAQLESIPEERAAARRVDTDRARELWVKRLYRADVTNPSWYHLWLDSTVLTTEHAVDIIEQAVARYLAAALQG